MPQEDKKFLKKLYTKTKHCYDRYTVPILWKDATVWLPNNQYMALRRCHHLMKRFKKDGHFLLKYKTTIQNYVSMEYARKKIAQGRLNQCHKGHSIFLII